MVTSQKISACGGLSDFRCISTILCTASRASVARDGLHVQPYAPTVRETLTYKRLRRHERISGIRETRVR